jgi:hypothetical protein
MPAADLSQCQRSCYTMLHTDAEVYGANSDHVPVLLHCPARADTKPKRATRITRVCYEQVWDSEKRKRYQELVAQAAPAVEAVLNFRGGYR